MNLIDWRNLKGGVVAALLAFALAACGGGDGESDSALQLDPPSSGAPGANRAPTIQGQPATSVVAGQQYSFQPSASDPDGDKLTFSVANLPGWATFSTTTGRISGTPGATNVGTYANITVQVSDGSASAKLAAFSITVSDVGGGSATLSWMPPAQNTDGSALTDLSGYQIRYGRSANDLSQTISIKNPSVSTYVVENLSSGAWYFAVTAVNSQGANSLPSNVASKTI